MSTATRDRAPGVDSSRDPREARAEKRGRERIDRVDAKKARGERPRSGESMDLADELDLMYDEGVAEGMKRGPKPRRPKPASSTSSRASSKPAAAPTRTPADAFPTPTIGANLDPAQGRTLILVFTTISALGAVARDTIHGTPANPASSSSTAALASFGAKDASSPNSAAQLASTKSTPAKPTEPVHLRALAGVFVVGTIALVLNEISPTLGVAMAGILLLDVGLSLGASPRGSSGQPTAAVIDQIGGALFNNSSTVTPIPNAPARPAPSQGTHV